MLLTNLRSEQGLDLRVKDKFSAMFGFRVISSSRFLVAVPRKGLFGVVVGR